MREGSGTGGYGWGRGGGGERGRERGESKVRERYSHLSMGLGMVTSVEAREDMRDANIVFIGHRLPDEYGLIVQTFRSSEPISNYQGKE